MRMANNFTVAVTHFVKDGLDDEFETALNKVISEAKKYIGYQEIQTVKLNEELGHEYLLLIRFDNEVNYKNWENSDFRNDWANDIKRFVIKQSKVRYQEGIEFWFSSPKQSVSNPPKRWKMATLTWLVVYPTILILSTLVSEYLGFLHLFLRMLVVSLIMVGAMTYFIMPRITKIFASWIFKK